ncbi:MAG: beta-CASP ribonuclease aCPSF1 [Aigarchaeota archaeon]|nr:beta-CASP ribonuclease aCPSF1 [Aigarchaeota archaeon]MCX8192197.1 beta-CASP ribonuclease aCPSF1 [Nitrososphaeria archaeon]MDW7986197.1 beta-CASP ribonuclease aCPSF1 [Nitrososphaerota archaeon]
MSQQLFTINKLRQEIFRYFSVINPLESGITKIDFEGPRIAIYTKNQELFRNQDQVAKDLVNLIKKRVVIRSDESIRLPREEVEEKIREYFKNVQGVVFNDLLGEVVIELSPDKPLPSDNELKLLSNMTLWSIKVERTTTMQTKTIEKVKKIIYGDPQYRVQVLRNIGERVFRDQTFMTNEVLITILGSGMQVGRSAILLQTTESKILLDCGYSLGGTSNLESFPRLDAIDNLVEELDAVVITHAHLDHMGMVPYLFKYGYRGPVYCTEPTLPLMLMQHLDFINVAEKEGVFPPYSEADARLAVQHTVTLGYGVVTNITPDVRITFYNSGHMLGSSVVHIHIGEGFHNIVYTSDFKFEDSRTLEACISKFPRIETLIMESTYGAAQTPFNRAQSEQVLAEYITKTIERGGKVFIPVPAVGRAQEIMLILNHLFESKSIPEVPVFLDGLVIEATGIHMAFPQYMNQEIARQIIDGKNVFLTEYFTPVRSTQQREEVLETSGPMIVIATSGMLEGGPILTYLREYAGDERNLLAFVSYQVEGTLGRRLLKDIREIQLMGENGKPEIVNVNMEIVKIDGFSGHSSKQELLNYVKSIQPKPKNVVLLHGEPEAVLSLSKSISKILPSSKIYTPRNLNSITLEMKA